MNKQRSLLESLNAGRQRQPHDAIEELNRTLETLGSRIESARTGLTRPLPRRDGWKAEDETAATGRDVGGTAGFADRAPARTLRDLARDVEDTRRQQENVTGVSRIASELKAMREELAQEVSAGLQREFEALREDFERAQAAGTTGGGAAGDGADKAVELLLEEVEQVKSALNQLAREDTLLSVDRRWDAFGRRFEAVEERLSHVGEGADTADMSSLKERLEQISEAVNHLPESLSLRSLEDKVRTLASAVEHFARQRDHASPEAFGLIGERLDEISRAIVASAMAAQSAPLPTEAFERIEARIASLARQIDELGDDRPAGELMDRINLLSSRVDEMARRAELPEQAIQRLGEQLAVIAGKLDAAPQPADAGQVLKGLEQRFSSLTDTLQKQQGDTFKRSQAIFRELEARLDALATRLDQSAADPAKDRESLMAAMDERFSELAGRFETQQKAAESEAAKGLERRLADMSQRLEQSMSQASGIDAEIIRSLEAQIAGLSAHLAKPFQPLPEFEDLGPRLDHIEQSIAQSRETILESARQAAEQTIRSFAGSASGNQAVTALADDLRALDDLARRSDERNTRTFEAIHDTLLKIVERLGALEFGGDREQAAQPAPAPERPARPLAATPPIEPAMQDDLGMEVEAAERPATDILDDELPVARTPAEAAAAAAHAAVAGETRAEEPARKGSMLKGLARALGRKNARPEPKLAGSGPAPDLNDALLDIDALLDPKVANRPLEPGAAAPDLNAIMKRVRDERAQTPRASESEAGKSDFIAAARRAAQAAAAEAEIKKKGFDKIGSARGQKLGGLFRSKGKTALLASVAIVVTAGGLQLGRAILSDDAIQPRADAAATAQPLPAAGRTDLAAADPDELVIEDEVQPLEAAVEPADLIPEPIEAAAEPAETTGEEPVRVIASAPPAEISEPAPAAVAPVEPPAPLSAAPAANMPEPDMPAVTAPVMPETTASTPAPAEDAAAAPLTAALPEEIEPAALRDAAAAGDPKALFEIGRRYEEGAGVTASPEKAAEWFLKSADLGFAPAQYRIGNYFEKATGVERDLAKARTYYKLAAEQGNAGAMHNLAVLQAMGADAAPDNEAAARWFLKAADLGVKDSQFNVAILSAKGIGMPQNLEESYKWFALVAKTGDKDAASKRDEVANALRPDQLDKARAAAELWKPQPLDPEANEVVVPDAWAEGPTTTATVDVKQAVRNIQLILAKNGYDPGGADGVMGQKTKSAIMAFQQANGMAGTGEVDEALVRALLKKK